MPAADATKFADSFSRYEVGNTVSDAALLAELTAYWTQTFLQLDITSSGRNGQALRVYFGSYIFKTLPHSGSWVVGFAFKLESGNGGGSLVQLQNNNNVVFFALGTNFDNTLTIYAGGVGGPIIGTSDKAIHRNQWYYAEVVVSYADSGTVHTTGKLFINGESWIASATADTGLHVSQTLSGDATTNVLMVQAGVVSAGSTLFDDLYTRSGTGARFGDVKIQGIVPNGDTSTNQFLTSSGSAHYSLVNEIPVDYDATYVYDGTVDHFDVWDWQDIPSFSGTLQSVVISICARKDDEGSKAFQIVAGSTGTDDHSEDFYVGDSYIYYHTAWDEIPGGGSWTRAAFNAERWGVKVIA